MEATTDSIFTEIIAALIDVKVIVYELINRKDGLNYEPIRSNEA